MRTRTLALGLILGIAMLAAPWAAAEDHHEDAAEEAAEGEENGTEWEYQIEVSSREARVEMSREQGENERSIEFEYKRDEASIEFGYESETTTSESEASMEVQFHQVFEYEDANGNGQYDAGETIVSAYQLSDDSEEELADDAAPVSWSAITQSAVTSDDGVSGTKFSSTANIGGGSLRLDFYVFGDDASLGAADVEATELKLDIAIDNYPYESATSSLGLLLESESETEVEDDDDVDRDEDGVRASISKSEVLRFAWKDFATVDGTDMDVKTTQLDSETEQSATEFEHEELIVFSYPRGDAILHDPTMGISSASSGFLGLPGPGIAVVGLGLAALAAARRP